MGRIWERRKTRSSCPLVPSSRLGRERAFKASSQPLCLFLALGDVEGIGDGAAASQTSPERKGVVCFITVAGFLNGPGFEAMRDYLRRTADDIWVIDCSPDGHQPDVPTRIFQGVQQPVCIVLVARTGSKDQNAPAAVRHIALPVGSRESKFEALGKLSFATGWSDCATEWRAPFLPGATGGWAIYPKLDGLFYYNGSGVMPGRTWVIAPDKDTLENRWKTLVAEKDPEKKEVLFHPHFRGGDLGDKYAGKVVSEGLHAHKHREMSVAKDIAPAIEPIRYGFRSFDRQWILPDSRLINQPNPTLWDGYSSKQVYLTALNCTSPHTGPGLSFTSLVPDLDHYNGRGGRVFPLWADAQGRASNVGSAVIAKVGEIYASTILAEDTFSYMAAVAAHPGYTARFAQDLIQPGLRIPLTADASLFKEAAALGREVIWLHTFGDRFASPKDGRPVGPPRLPQAERPQIPANGVIPSTADDMPASITYDLATRRLHIGKGYVDNVPPEVWGYEVSGKQVLTQWFSYRGRDRSRPIIGDRRPPSPLNHIQPVGWLAEYTTELLNVLNVLGLLVKLEPKLADLLNWICAGPTITADDIKAAAVSEKAPPTKKAARRKNAKQGELLS